MPEFMDAITRVAIGIVFHNNKFLVTIRPEGTSFAGFYEFPGGKLELGETPYQALCREMNEEVGLTIQKATLLMERDQTLPMRPLQLSFWTIDEFEGEAEGKEGQQLHWLSAAALCSVNFLPANKPVIEALLKKLDNPVH